MMNFLNNMNLLPKNFIVANVVEVLKEDPENGVEKLYEMSQTFVTDPQVKGIVGQIKEQMKLDNEQCELLLNAIFERR